MGLLDVDRSKPLIPDDKIPAQFDSNGERWIVIDKNQNYYYRVCALPIFRKGITIPLCPTYFNNDDCLKLFDNTDKV